MQLDTACLSGPEESCLPGLAHAGPQSVHALRLSCCRAEAAKVELDSRLKAVCKENEVQRNALASDCARLTRDLQGARESAGTRHQHIQASCCRDRRCMRAGTVRAAACILERCLNVQQLARELQLQTSSVRPLHIDRFTSHQ